MTPGDVRSVATNESAESDSSAMVAWQTTQVSMWAESVSRRSAVTVPAAKSARSSWDGQYGVLAVNMERSSWNTNSLGLYKNNGAIGHFFHFSS